MEKNKMYRKFSRAKALELLCNNTYLVVKRGEDCLFYGQKELEDAGIEYHELGQVCPHEHPGGYGGFSHVLLIKIGRITEIKNHRVIFLLIENGELIPLTPNDFE